MYLAELSYWGDVDTDGEQMMWTDDGGSVNIHGRVFGTDGGSSVGNTYAMPQINQNNPYKTYATHIMAGFLGNL